MLVVSTQLLKPKPSSGLSLIGSNQRHDGPMKNKDEYSEQEAQQRFMASLKAAVNTPPKPLKSMSRRDRRRNLTKRGADRRRLISKEERAIDAWLAEFRTFCFQSRR
jgi:hypothetical protein